MRQPIFIGIAVALFIMLIAWVSGTDLDKRSDPLALAIMMSGVFGVVAGMVAAGISGKFQ